MENKKIKNSNYNTEDDKYLSSKHKTFVENNFTKSNKELHEKLKYLVRTERNLLTTILDHLAEVRRRRIYTELGYSSLFNYCTKELNYSESAAVRRIQALKLTEELPEIKDKLNSGALNLSTISLAQTFFQKEKILCNKSNPNLPLLDSLSLGIPEKNNINLDKQEHAEGDLNHKTNTIENNDSLWTSKQILHESKIPSKFTTKFEKLEFLKSLENKTTKEAQKEMAKIAPEATLTFETQKPLTENLTELKIIVNENQLNKLNQLKALRPDFKSTAELLEWLCDQSLKKFDSKNSDTNNIKNVDVMKKDLNQTHANSVIRRSLLKNHKNAQNYTTDKKAIKLSLKKHVYRKSNNQCSFVAQNGHKCLETHGLEVDHIFPKAKGGNNSIPNLRLLCKAHNQLEAIKHFGLDHMQKYLE